MDGVRSGKTRALGKSTVNRYGWERAEEFRGVALEVSEQFLLRHTLQKEIKLARIVAATFVVVRVLGCWSDAKNSFDTVRGYCGSNSCSSDDVLNKRRYGTRC